MTTATTAAVRARSRARAGAAPIAAPWRCRVASCVIAAGALAWSTSHAADASSSYARDVADASSYARDAGASHATRAASPHATDASSSSQQTARATKTAAPARAAGALPAKPASKTAARGRVVGSAARFVKVAASTGPGYRDRPDVADFVDRLVADGGFDRAAVMRLLNDARFSETSVRLMMPAATLAGRRDWNAYRARFVEPVRLAAGLAFWDDNAMWLARAERDFGVPPEIVVGILGCETVYGRNTGSFRVLDTLTTLSFDYPATARDRSPFFREQLIDALTLDRDGTIDLATLRGSYAGAIGMPQFMPGSIRRFAIDYDGDGRVDLVSSPADVIGSVANFLAGHGWVRGLPTRVGLSAARSLPADASSPTASSSAAPTPADRPPATDRGPWTDAGGSSSSTAGAVATAPSTSAATSSAGSAPTGAPGSASTDASPAPADTASRRARIQAMVDAGSVPSFDFADLAGVGFVADALPPDARLALIDLPTGVDAGGNPRTQYVAGTQNFHVVTRYNRSYFYALSVIELGEAIKAMREARPASSNPSR